jgi:hypothetical protein
MNSSTLTELGQCIESSLEAVLELEKNYKNKDERKLREAKKFILDMQSKIDSLLK